MGDIPAELYRWFLVSYGVTAVGRVVVESYKQIVILQTDWYDVPTASLSTLEHGFLQHALLSLATAEGINMVLGALMKRKARVEGHAEGRARGLEDGLAEGRAQGLAEGRAEANQAWIEWLLRKTEAETKGEPFDEPTPADLQAKDNGKQ